MCTERPGAGESHRGRVACGGAVIGTCTGVLAAMGLTACNGTSSYLDATGTPGHAEGVLGQWLTGVACAVVLIICAAILWAIARHRGEHNVPSTYPGAGGPRRAEPLAPPGTAAHDTADRPNVRSGLNWIYIGLAATVVVLLLTFAGTMATLNAASRPPRIPTLTLDVIGHQWWWEVRYLDDASNPAFAFTTANEVHLPVGQPVRVRLRSADVIHSFWLPQISGKMDLIPGQVNETWLEARHPGTSRGACAEYCGLQHAVMALTVTAEPPERFARWAQARRADANVPATPETRAGRVVFARSCGACHAVQGTDALGRYGPDLTHVATRPYIGAGALANTPANLTRWIRNAQVVKVGARMPAMPLDTAELRAVVAYLETLH